MSLEVLPCSDRGSRALIELSKDAIALVTRNRMITYANPATEHVTGYASQELEGMNCFALLHPDDLKEVRQHYALLLDRPGHTASVTYRLRHKDGAWHWMEGTLTNLLNEQAVGAVVWNYRDITERKREQERLRRSEERYQALVEQTSDGILVTDEQGCLIEVNLAGSALYGSCREEMLTKHIVALLPEEDRPAVWSRLKCLGEGEITCFQLRIRRKDGTRLPVVLRATRLSTGYLLGLVRAGSVRIQSHEMVQPIPSHNQIEELNRKLEAEKGALLQAKQEAEARAAELAAIFEAMNDGVVVCDTRGDIHYTNAAYRSMMGLAEDADPSVLRLDNRFAWHNVRDIEGKPLSREQLVVTRILRGERLSGTDATDFLGRTIKGDEIIVNITGTPIRDITGQIVGGVMVFRDATERHRLEQQLQYSERKLRALVESNILGVAVSDAEGRIHETNEQFARTLGYTREEMLSGAVTRDDLIPDDYREAIAYHSEILVTTGAMPPWEKECLRKDGTRVPTLMAGAMIDRERGLALMLFHDISDRKEAEQRKQEFLGMVSHELRTPLTAIMGLIELALMQIEQHSFSLTPEGEKLIKRIEQALRRANGQVEIETRLVEQLLDVSRLEVNKFELSSREENLLEIVRDVVANQQQVARSRQIQLFLPPNEQVSVMVDAARIGQVLSNYVTNALKYSSVERGISVSLMVGQSSVRVSVSDEGPGLTLEEQRRVWESFYRSASSCSSRCNDGLGLGLAISKAIIEQHHGQVGVESCLDHGSTFWFTLPLIDDPMRS